MMSGSSSAPLHEAITLYVFGHFGLGVELDSFFSLCLFSLSSHEHYVLRPAQQPTTTSTLVIDRSTFHIGGPSASLPAGKSIRST